MIGHCIYWTLWVLSNELMRMNTKVTKKSYSIIIKMKQVWVACVSSCCIFPYLLFLRSFQNIACYVSLEQVFYMFFFCVYFIHDLFLLCISSRYIVEMIVFFYSKQQLQCVCNSWRQTIYGTINKDDKMWIGTKKNYHFSTKYYCYMSN